MPEHVMLLHRLLRSWQLGFSLQDSLMPLLVTSQKWPLCDAHGCLQVCFYKLDAMPNATVDFNTCGETCEQGSSYMLEHVVTSLPLAH
jgi:hypothetical protein